jgi:ribosomal-protein-serine acetyltransferase
MFEAVDSSRAHLLRFLPWVDFLKSVDDEAKWIGGCVRAWKERTQFVYAMFLADGTYIGNIDAHHIDWNHHRVELGYWIAKEHEGHGYVGESVCALEQKLFAVGFHRIEIRCNTRNKRSSNIPRRNGYKFEGTLRQDAVENGRYRDTMVFAKLIGI